MYVDVSAMKHLLEYQIDYITMGLLNIYIYILFSTMIYYRGTQALQVLVLAVFSIVIFNFVF